MVLSEEGFEIPIAGDVPFKATTCLCSNLTLASSDNRDEKNQQNQMCRVVGAYAAPLSLAGDVAALADQKNRGVSFLREQRSRRCSRGGGLMD